jgi:hypothetical protein
VNGERDPGQGALAVFKNVLYGVKQSPELAIDFCTA